MIETLATEGFTFELLECKKAGSVTCYFMITSNEQDKKLDIQGSYRPSRIFDDLGNEYFATRAQLGNRSANQGVESLLIAGIPTKASVNFSKISSQAGTISLLELNCYKFKLQFRNVPFSE
ncbi:MAG: hypothetical protein D3910_10430 [Candidatus Electrothrix sp. ATG2]|nr:hypothetical protein [Candidatus Electrothrix sp. ATG2]